MFFCILCHVRKLTKVTNIEIMVFNEKCSIFITDDIFLSFLYAAILQKFFPVVEKHPFTLYGLYHGFMMFWRRKYAFDIRHK